MQWTTDFKLLWWYGKAGLRACTLGFPRTLFPYSNCKEGPCRCFYLLSTVDGLFLIHGVCQPAEKEVGSYRLGSGSVLGKALWPWHLKTSLSQCSFPPAQLNFALIFKQVSWGRDSCPSPSSWKLLLTLPWDCFFTLAGHIGLPLILPQPWWVLASATGAKAFAALLPSVCVSQGEGAGRASLAPSASLFQVCTPSKAFSKSPAEIPGEEPSSGVKLKPAFSLGSQEPYSCTPAYTSLWQSVQKFSSERVG